MLVYGYFGVWSFGSAFRVYGFILVLSCELSQLRVVFFRLAPTIVFHTFP